MTWDQLIPDPINLHGGEQDIAGLTDWIWDQFRMILKIILKKKAKSPKLQAASNA